MKRGKILFIFMLIPFLSFAQKSDSLTLDTLKKPSPNYYGGFFLDIRGFLGPGFSKPSLIGSYGVGIQYEKWIIGFSTFHFVGDVEHRLVFPNLFKLNYLYGGPYITFSGIKTNVLTFPLTIGYYMGDMTWERDEDKEKFFRDEFTIIEGSFTVELSKLRYSKPYLSIGFQQMTNLNLVSIENKYFSGFFVRIGIRVGYFNQ